MNAKRVRFTILLLLPISLLVWIPLVMLLSGSLTGVGEWSLSLGALSRQGDSLSFPLVPQYPTLVPWLELLLDTPEFFHMFWNSAKITIPVVAGQVLVGAPAAWALERFRFFGRKAVAFLYILLMLLPFQVTMVSNYLVLDRLSLINTRLSIILPGIFSPFPVFIMMRSFAGIPKAMEEAAMLDGAGAVQTFFLIGLPLAVPGILSAVVLGFIDYWNMMEQPLTFLRDPSLWPLSLFLPDLSPTTAGVAFAASVLILIPALLVFLFGESYLEQGMAAAGVKE